MDLPALSSSLREQEVCTDRNRSAKKECRFMTLFFELVLLFYWGKLNTVPLLTVTLGQNPPQEITRQQLWVGTALSKQPNFCNFIVQFVTLLAPFMVNVAPIHLNSFLCSFLWGQQPALRIWKLFPQMEPMNVLRPNNIRILLQFKADFSKHWPSSECLSTPLSRALGKNKWL